MTPEKQIEITEICKKFASAFEDTIGEINGSGWLIVDPLSAYLNASGIENELVQLPADENRPLILVMKFKDGSQLIPAGEDLKYKFPDATNWQWALKK